MNKIIIANWKANPTTLGEALGLFDFSVTEASKYQNIKTIICPPFVYLEEIAKRVQGTGYRVQLGAQDTFWENSGPYTGEISVDMLHPVKSPVKSNEVGAEQFHRGARPVKFSQKEFDQGKQFDGVKNFGVTYVLVGHSDRRYKMGETDDVINKKIKAVLEAEIIPVLLVGERNRNDDRKTVLEQQLAADLTGLTAEQISKILITYEPVWAISTQPNAEPDTPENTLGALKIIQEFLSITYNLKPITYLYGGSINSKNAADFLKHPELSGAVIGGASLRKDEFAHILSQISLLT